MIAIFIIRINLDGVCKVIAFITVKKHQLLKGSGFDLKQQPLFFEKLLGRLIGIKVLWPTKSNDGPCINQCFLHSSVFLVGIAKALPPAPTRDMMCISTCRLRAKGARLRCICIAAVLLTVNITWSVNKRHSWGQRSEWPHDLHVSHHHISERPVSEAEGSAIQMIAGSCTAARGKCRVAPLTEKPPAAAISFFAVSDFQVATYLAQAGHS